MLAGIPQDLRPASPAKPGKPAMRRPSLADSLVYLDHWLPNTLRRVKVISDKCTGIDSHVLSPS